LSPTQRQFVRFKVLQAIEHNPTASQRELSKELGVSLGSINYCIKALVDKGLIKVDNFVKSDKKRGYAYYLTPQGIFDKAEITGQFLKRKKEEYALLKAEIAELQAEIKKADADDVNRNSHIS
jgi:EPS-associated MarR family transcriptional regulator